jgi:hypothetical protein
VPVRYRLGERAYGFVRFPVPADGHPGHEVGFVRIGQQSGLRYPPVVEDGDAQVQQGGADADGHLAPARVEDGQAARGVGVHVDRAGLQQEPPRLGVVDGGRGARRREASRKDVPGFHGDQHLTGP